mmetsp:Transcript_20889/g.39053  ORF Transcript_20889/g.39053 Transcript_20889/m.39053 type:complete len:240 (-) Transcript_20889:872-1591(-)
MRGTKMSHLSMAIGPSEEGNGVQTPSATSAASSASFLWSSQKREVLYQASNSSKVISLGLPLWNISFNASSISASVGLSPKLNRSFFNSVFSMVPESFSSHFLKAVFVWALILVSERMYHLVNSEKSIWPSPFSSSSFMALVSSVSPTGQSSISKSLASSFESMRPLPDSSICLKTSETFPVNLETIPTPAVSAMDPSFMRSFSMPALKVLGLVKLTLDPSPSSSPSSTFFPAFFISHR